MIKHLMIMVRCKVTGKLHPCECYNVVAHPVKPYLTYEFRVFISGKVKRGSTSEFQLVYTPDLIQLLNSIKVPYEQIKRI